MRALALSLFALAACSGKSDSAADDTSAETDADTDADSDTDTDADSDTDTNPLDDTIDLPDSPLPVRITIGGDADGSANFDTIVCSHPPNNQLQLTYSDSTTSYSWNLRVFVREAFTGAGDYSTNVQVQLIENFSGGRYFAGSQDEGAVVTVDGFGTNGTYGSFVVDELLGDLGSATIAPQPVPFWCDVIDD